MKNAILLLFLCCVGVVCADNQEEEIVKGYAKKHFLEYKTFDFTKKGNVFEKTFRMPFNIWGSAIQLGICFDTEFYIETNIEGSKEYVKQKQTQWRNNLFELWEVSYHYRCKDEKTQEKQDTCYHKERQKADDYIRLLESYHPNQFFKFKLTFMPISNPQEKIEKIIELPLYHKPKNYFGIPYFGRNGRNYHCIILLNQYTSFLRKYYIRLEVLNSTILPDEITPRISLYNPSTKH